MQDIEDGYCVEVGGNKVNFSISARDEEGRPIEGLLFLVSHRSDLAGVAYSKRGDWGDDEAAYADLAVMARDIAQSNPLM